MRCHVIVQPWSYPGNAVFKRGQRMRCRYMSRDGASLFGPACLRGCFPGSWRSVAAVQVVDSGQNVTRAV